MHFSPDLAFLLAIGGILSIYIEVLRPGKIVPGLVGCCLAAVGGYSLWQDSPTLRGVLLIACAGLCFVLEAFIETHFIASAVGTASLMAGAVLLLPPPFQINWLLACMLSLFFGAITCLLAHAARQARRNKWADLSNEQ
jgi:membrane-bound serine protease (ClpP class)